MKTSSVSLSLLTATLFAVTGFAQSAPPPAAPADAPAGPPPPPGHERLMQRFDTNHDGKLDDTERAAARAEWQKRMAERGGPDGAWGGGPREGRGWGPRGHGDFDGPGPQQGMKQMRHHREMRAAMHRRMMAKFDHDHDGRLNDAEFAEAKKFRDEMRAKMREHHQLMLERFDANHDGKITGDERKALREAFEDFLKSRPALPAAAK